MTNFRSEKKESRAMDLEQIASIVSVVLSAIATIVATFKKAKTIKTVEEIEENEELKKQKRIAKAMKKNHIKVDTATKSEVVKTSEQNLTSNSEKNELGLITEVK